ACSLAYEVVIICSIRCNVRLVSIRPANNYLIIYKSSVALALQVVEFDHLPLDPLGHVAARVVVSTT
ncbi:Hypothetical predicted protein, partial [Olea europaea subsp. europaea]